MAYKYLFFISLIISACAPSVATQGERDKKDAPPPPPAAGGPRPTFTTPASYYEPVGPFFFYVDTLTSTGPSKYGFTPTQPCIQTGVFKRGMRMVVRFEVLDT